jgi:release factor glutamine methyltransferase
MLEQRDAMSLMRASGLEPLDAAVLAALALGVPREWLLGHDRDPLDANQVLAILAVFELRRSGLPVAYLCGEREFHGHAFQVTRDTLIPRPETELLVDCAIDAAVEAAARVTSAVRPPRDGHSPTSMRGPDPVRILDLGTGSGAIAISMERALAMRGTAAQICAVERSTHALAVARRNADRLQARIEFLAGDWFEPLDGRRFDLIVSNPPYVASGDRHLSEGDLRYEPASALAAGVDGLDALRTLVARAPAHLLGGGALLLEHGHDQGAAVRALLGEAGFGAVRTVRDLAGIERVSGGCRER